MYIEYEKLSQEEAQKEADKIEDDKIQDALAWAEAEEEKEKNSKAGLSESDKEWMEAEIAKAKDLYGEDFGEDISEDFTDA